MPQYLTTSTDRKIAYVQTPAEGAIDGPGVVFLGGLLSDMGGTKAVFLEEWAHAQGRAFLRFDYSGHGLSSGRFTDGCIGDWAADACEVITTLTQGPQVLVGSSMGGWISLILSGRMPEKIAGIVGIASAPDFTEDSMWAGFSDAQRADMAKTGQVALPSDYGEPYIITRRMIEDGRTQLVLRKPLYLPFPARFLQGDADADVKLSVALRLLEQARGDNIRLSVVKGADHRFSTPECLGLIATTLAEVVALAGQSEE